MDTTTNIAGLLDIRSQKSDGSESLKIMKKKRSGFKEHQWI